MGEKGRYRRWRLRRFHRRCDRLRIPADVRERLLKMGDTPPDWYAGRQTPEPEPTWTMARSDEIVPGVRLMTVEFSEEENLRLAGWREALEEEGQELWRIYHWIVDAQGGKAHGIYRLRDWLEHFNVPDKTGGQHWKVRD